MPRDGWFITDDHLIYQLINGSAYLVINEEKLLDAAVRALQPGYYDQRLKRVEVE